MRKSVSFQSKYATPLLVSLLISAAPAFSADSTTGQSIDDSSGNPFMEEIVDPKEKQKEEEKLKGAGRIDRHKLTPEELSRVGIQVSPKGDIIPLINRYGPPVAEYGSRMTVDYQPIIPVTPWGMPVMPAMPYGNVPYGYPFSGGYSSPLTPFGVPVGGAPFFGGGWGGFGGMPYYGTPYINPFGNSSRPWLRGLGGIIGGLAANNYGYYGGAYGYNTPFWPGGFPVGPTVPVLAPYSIPLYDNYMRYVPTETGYKWDTSTSAPQGSVAAGSSFSTSGSFLSRPFWGGFGGSSSILGGYLGGGIGIPSITEYDSTTTFTPILPPN